VSDLDFQFRSGAPAGSGGSLRGAQDVVARAQRLVDTPRPVGGYPLKWHVEALHVGDLTAIAVAALRASDSGSVPSAR
jgi:hypothetical protein